MKRLLFKFLGLCLFLSLSACAQKINDQTIKNYIQAVQSIRKISPEISKQLQSPTFNLLDGQSHYQEINQTVQKAGFKDISEFIQVNNTIAIGFGQTQSKQFLGDVDKQMKQGLEQIDAQLKNPALPAQTRRQLEASKQSMIDHYTNSKKWADDVMNVMNKGVDPETAQLIQAHKQELSKLYQGR